MYYITTTPNCSKGTTPAISLKMLLEQLKHIKEVLAVTSYPFLPSRKNLYYSIKKSFSEAQQEFLINNNLLDSFFSLCTSPIIGSNVDMIFTSSLSFHVVTYTGLFVIFLATDNWYDVVEIYNKGMGGCDLSSQLRSS